MPICQRYRASGRVSTDRVAERSVDISQRDASPYRHLTETLLFGICLVKEFDFREI